MAPPAAVSLPPSRSAYTGAVGWATAPSAATSRAPPCPAGAFRDNVVSFLSECGVADRYAAPGEGALGPGVRAWNVPLRGLQAAQLRVYEHAVLRSGSPHCDACRCVGWAHHPVSGLSYHVVLHADAALTPHQCAACGEQLDQGCEKGGCCGVCGTARTQRAPHIFQVTRHRLHGVLHANGYGHLLRICGREAGSALLGGTALLALWDELCSRLRVRFVTVQDVSTKGGLPLRLLHGCAYGCTWYGSAGYGFGRGGFGTSRGAHKRALDALSKFSLQQLKQDFALLPRAGDEGVRDVIARYEALAAVAAADARPGPGRKCSKLTTLGELIALVLGCYAGRGPATASALMSQGSAASSLLAHPPAADAPPDAAAASVRKRPRPKTELELLAPSSASAAPRFSAERVTFATDACLHALQAAARGAWMARPALRECARATVRDTGLLDHALKHLADGMAVAGGCKLVRRLCPHSKTHEFRLVPAAAASAPCAPPVQARAAGSGGALPPPSRETASADLSTLYRSVLESYLPLRAGCVPAHGAGAALASASLVVHDTKLFQKDFRGELPLGAHGGSMRVLVTPALGHHRAGRAPTTAGWAGGRPNRRREPPSELLVLPLHATVADLKAAATQAFRALYPCLDGFTFESVEGLALCGDRTRVALKPLAAGGTAPVQVWGSFGAGPRAAARAASLASSPLRFQGGVEEWQVRCGCGVADDDGERMFECGTCGVWKHTRCEGVPDDEQVPDGLACAACAEPGAPPGAHTRSKKSRSGKRTKRR